MHIIERVTPPVLHEFIQTMLFIIIDYYTLCSDILISANFVEEKFYFERCYPDHSYDMGLYQRNRCNPFQGSLLKALIL